MRRDALGMAATIGLALTLLTPTAVALAQSPEPSAGIASTTPVESWVKGTVHVRERLERLRDLSLDDDRRRSCPAT
jgi:hypothetical protein